MVSGEASQFHTNLPHEGKEHRKQELHQREVNAEKRVT